MKLSSSFTKISGVPILVAQSIDDTIRLLKYLDSIEDIKERPYGTLNLRIESPMPVKVFYNASFDGFHLSNRENLIAVFRTNLLDEKPQQMISVDVKDIHIYSINQIPTISPTYRNKLKTKNNPPIAMAVKRKRVIAS